MFTRKSRSKSKDREPNLLRELAAAMEDTNTNQNQSMHDESADPNPPNTPNISEDIAGIRSRDGSETRSHRSHYSEFDLNEAFKRLSNEDSFKTTINDALGRLLVENSAQVQHLSKKAHVPVSTNPEQTCDQYAEHLTNLDEKITQMIQAKMEPINQTIKEMKTPKQITSSFRSKTETIFPPTDFATYETLEGNERRQAFANYEFPIKTRFNGKRVVEFLRRINGAQKNCVLSEKEFKEYLLKCTVDEVFDDLVALIDGGSSIQDIYDMLLDNYDDRQTPASAKEDLDQLIPEADATLQTVKNKIQKLGLRAKLMYAKSAQEQGYHHDTVQTLLKALPKASYQDGLRCYTQLALTAPNGIPTYRSFCQALIEVEPVINHHYQNEKHIRVGKMEASRKKSVFSTNPYRRTISRFTRKLGQAKIQQIDSRQNSAMQGLNRENRTHNRNPERPRHNSDQRDQNGQRDQIRRPSNTYPHKSSGGYNRNFTDKGRRDNNPNKMELGVKGKLHCSLCSSSTHSAAMMCYKMRNDAGKIVFCPPSQASCTRCEEELNKHLYHPAALCFLRPRYKQLLAEGKIKYPSYSERKELQDHINDQSK